MTELALRFGEVLCWTGVMQWKCITPLERADERGRKEGCFINIALRSQCRRYTAIYPGSEKRETKFRSISCVP